MTKKLPWRVAHTTLATDCWIKAVPACGGNAQFHKPGFYKFCHVLRNLDKIKNANHMTGIFYIHLILITKTIYFC